MVSVEDVLETMKLGGATGVDSPRVRRNEDQTAMSIRRGCSRHSYEDSSNSKLEKSRLVANERTTRNESGIAERHRLSGQVVRWLRKQRGVNVG